MLVYNILLAFILLLGVLLCEVRKSRLNSRIFLICVSAAMIVIAYLRADTVGIDYKQYETYYNQVRQGGWAFLISSGNPYRVEPGYSLLNYIVSRFTADVHIYMLVVAIVVITLTAVLLDRFSPIPWIGMFVFVSFGFYGNSLSFIRQTIAISIFLFSIEYLKQKKFVPYLLIILLASTFHKSMLIMIPVYFIAHIRLNWKSIASYCGLAAVTLALSWPMFNLVTKYIYQAYATEQGLYYMIGRDWQTAAIPVITTVIVLILKDFILRRDPKNIVLLNYSLYSGLLYIMTCQHFLYQRFGMMFFTSAILLVPELLASVGVESVQAGTADRLKGHKEKGKDKKAFQEQRRIKSQMNMHKYIYYYSATALVAVGFLYHVWILLQNRINLTPYLTFFSQK